MLNLTALPAVTWSRDMVLDVKNLFFEGLEYGYSWQKEAV